MINYTLLGVSCDYYERQGFKRVELPWTVTPAMDDITRPNEAVPFELKHNGKRLVASGEQSFLYLSCKEYLPLGKYFGITPCFRYEPYDFTHKKTFIKNELFVTDVVNETELNSVIEKAFNFFKLHIPFNHKDKLQIVKTDENKYDINLLLNDKEYEIGSYGIRTCEFVTWIYGTAIAEPRFSSLLNLLK